MRKSHHWFASEQVRVQQQGVPGEFWVGFHSPHRRPKKWRTAIELGTLEVSSLLVIALVAVDETTEAKHAARQRKKIVKSAGMWELPV